MAFSYGIFGNNLAGTNTWNNTRGTPFLNVSPIGLSTSGVTQSNNGANYGPDTAGTTTSGINEAIKSLTTGGHIFLLPSTTEYNITSQITDQGNSGIILEGSGISSLIYPQATFSNHIIQIAQANWTVRNLGINGTNQGTGGLYYGILFASGSTNGVIEHNYITATDQSGITFQGSGHVVTENQILSVYSDCITTLSASHSTIIGNICGATSLHNNISIVGGTDLNVTGNTCNSATANGIALENLSTFGECLRVSVTGNSISNPTLNGFRVYGQNSSVDSAKDCTFSGNTIYNTGDSGIYILSGSGLTIGNNAISTTTQHGINLIGSALDDITIVGNSIDSPTDAGILNVTGGTRFAISGNTIRNWGTTQRGIDLEAGSDYSIVGNLLEQGTSGSAQHGIYVASVLKGLISGNLVYGNAATGKGIWLNSTSTDWNVLGNYVDGWGVGIDEGTGSNYNVVVGNNVRNNNSTALTMVGANSVAYDNIGASNYNGLTTLSGTTAGTGIWAQTDVGNAYKRFVIYFSGYENDTASNQTISYPTAFSNTPIVSSNNSGLTVSSSTSVFTITAPDSTTTYTGLVIVEGY